MFAATMRSAMTGTTLFPIMRTCCFTGTGVPSSYLSMMYPRGKPCANLSSLGRSIRSRMSETA